MTTTIDKKLSENIPSAPFPVTLTEKAAEYMKRAMESEGLSLDTHGVRVGVRGGGCAGLQYVLEFDDNKIDNDYADKQYGIEVYVDEISATHITGTTVDYLESLDGFGFKFINPNIQRSCGCGQSFG